MMPSCITTRRLNVFPSNIVAGFGQFQRATLFELTVQEEREPVKVQF